MKAKQVEGEYKSVDGVENIDKVIGIDQSPIGRTPKDQTQQLTPDYSLQSENFLQIQKKLKLEVTNQEDLVSM